MATKDFRICHRPLYQFLCHFTWRKQDTPGYNFHVLACILYSINIKNIHLSTRCHNSNNFIKIENTEKKWSLRACPMHLSTQFTCNIWSLKPVASFLKSGGSFVGNKICEAAAKALCEHCRREAMVGGSGGMPPLENFEKLSVQIRHFLHSGNVWQCSPSTLARNKYYDRIWCT